MNPGLLHGSMGENTCPICLSSDREVCRTDVRDYVTGASFSIRRCRICGLGATVPPPEALSRHYPVSYRRYWGPVRATLKLLYARRMRALTHAIGRVGVALDLGCGDGWMLQALRRYGWAVLGIERTHQSAAVAFGEHHLPMVVGGLEAIRPQPCLDLIIMFHVLEHLPEPLATLHQCAQRLKAGGILIVAVPNLTSWQARCFGKHWFHLDVPRHRFHFARKSLMNALNLAGFDVQALHDVSWEHDPYGWLQSGLNRLGFPHNQLTKLLMGMEKTWASTVGAIAMAFVGLTLLVPSVLLASVSWVARAGAIIVVQARKREAASREGG